MKTIKVIFWGAIFLVIIISCSKSKATQRTDDKTSKGDLIPQTIIKQVEIKKIAIGLCVGPEDLASDKEGFIYSGMADGRIMRFNIDGSNPQQIVNTNGRPLGLEFDHNGNLIVCDAYKGLLSIDVNDSITILTHEHNGCKSSK
jgi:hypothetical protein